MEIPTRVGRVRQDQVEAHVRPEFQEIIRYKAVAFLLEDELRFGIVLARIYLTHVNLDGHFVPCAVF